MYNHNHLSANTFGWTHPTGKNNYLVNYKQMSNILLRAWFGSEHVEIVLNDKLIPFHVAMVITSLSYALSIAR